CSYSVCYLATSIHSIIFILINIILLQCIIYFLLSDAASTQIYTLSLHDALPISLPHPISTDTVLGRHRPGSGSAGLAPCNRLISSKRDNAADCRVLPRGLRRGMIERNFRNLIEARMVKRETP